jgi:hypothetical protein
MEPVKPEEVLPQVYEYGGENNTRSTEYSDSHHLRTLTGTRTPSVEELELDGGRVEPRRDQVWYGAPISAIAKGTTLTSQLGEC